jgi:hypothetical protein
VLTNPTPIAMFPPTLGTRVRIAGRRLSNAARESEWLPVAAVMILILAVLLAPLVYVFARVR